MLSKDYFSVLLPSLAFSVALYTFLSTSPRFREFGRKFAKFVILQLAAILNCSFWAFLEQLKNSLVNIQNLNINLKPIEITENILIYVLLSFFILSWIYLCYIFYTIYGSMYYMRKSRFLKYTKPIAWIYEKFFHKKYYEKSYRERTMLSAKCLSSINWNIVNHGGSILLLYNPTFDCLDLIADYIKEVIENEETVDYVAAGRHPIEIIQKISNKVSDNDLLKIAKKLSLIDCFSFHYAFDDKILKFKKEDWEQKGFKFYQADSFASIHTATNSSWYRFRRQCKNEENYYRVPHRTIFHMLSSLINFSSEEQFFLYLRHVLSSEKAYGMITLLIEPSNLDPKIKNNLISSVDLYFEIN